MSATCTTEEAAEILSVGGKKVAKLIRAGLLIGHKEGD